MDTVILVGLLLGLDLVLLVVIGLRLGVLITAAGLVTLSVVGRLLLRRITLAKALRAADTSKGESSPGLAVAENVLLSAAGMALVFPGFLTDGLAFLLMVPPIRAWAARHLLARLRSLGGPGLAGTDVHLWGGSWGSVDGDAAPRRPMKYVRNEAARR